VKYMCMCYRVALLRTDVSEEIIVSIMTMERIKDLETMSTRSHPDDGGDAFLRKVGSNKSHTASHPKRLNSS
jgi:hypothetical protein